MGRKIVVLLVAVAVLCMTIPAYATTAEWWKKAAAPYKGITLKGIGQSTPPSEVVRDVIAPEFEKLTGIKIDFEVQPWGVQYEKVIRDMDTGAGIYDFAYIEQDGIYGFLQKDWLVDMTKIWQEHPELTDPDLDLADFTKFIEYYKDPATGHIYGLPFEAFLKMYVYRTDLFEDPEIMRAFKSEYGWDLRPAINWEEYEQIAKFFTEWGKKKGIELYGHTAQAKTGYQALPYEMVESIWPTWGIYNWGINLNNWRTSVKNGGTLNGDLAKEAFRWYIDMLQYAPPGVKTYTWDEEAASLAAGKVAQGLTYCEFLGALLAVPEKSKIVGKFAVTMPPSSPQSMNEAVRGIGYLGYYDGASYSILHAAKNPLPAALFIQFIVRKDFAIEYARRASRVVRKSTFASPMLKELDQQQGGYFTAFQKYEFLFAGAAPLPMHLVIIDIYMDWISKAVAGEVSPDDALDSLAEEIDSTMIEMGY